jgi:hypothetical protein
MLIAAQKNTYWEQNNVSFSLKHYIVCSHFGKKVILLAVFLFGAVK